MKYIKKEKPSEPNPQEIGNKINEIIGNREITITTQQDGKIIGLEIDDKGLSASKKKELQNYVDTLEN